LRFDEAAVLHKLAALDDDELARFVMLCSFAHYGANQDGNSKTNQKLVVELSQEVGANYGLIDAQVMWNLINMQARCQALISWPKIIEFVCDYPPPLQSWLGSSSFNQFEVRLR